MTGGSPGWRSCQRRGAGATGYLDEEPSGKGRHVPGGETGRFVERCPGPSLWKSRTRRLPRSGGPDRNLWSRDVKELVTQHVIGLRANALDFHQVRCTCRTPEFRIGGRSKICSSEPGRTDAACRRDCNRRSCRRTRAVANSLSLPCACSAALSGKGLEREGSPRWCFGFVLVDKRAQVVLPHRTGACPGA